MRARADEPAVEEASPLEAGFLWSQTEFGSDDESSSRRWADREMTIRQRPGVHGARPLGASCESNVSGSPQCGQVSSAGGWVVCTPAVVSLLVMAESSCLAFRSSCR